jgi:hypothetical protein
MQALELSVDPTEKERIWHAISNWGMRAPEEELSVVRDRPELFKDDFIAFLKELACCPDLVERRPDLPLTALYSLASCRAKEAFPAAVAMLRALDEERCDLAFGDCLHEDVGLAVAALFDGDLTPVKDALLDRNAYLFAKAALLDATEALVYLGETERASAVALLDGVARELIAAENDPERCEDEDGTVDWALRSLAQCDCGTAERTILETGWDLSLWGVFSMEDLRIGWQERDKERFESIPELFKDGPLLAAKFYRYENPAEEGGDGPFRFPELPDDADERDMPVFKVVEPGRNDPCDCGSGKKYKKCCLDKRDRMALYR